MAYARPEVSPQTRRSSSTASTNGEGALMQQGPCSQKLLDALIATRRGRYLFFFSNCNCNCCFFGCFGCSGSCFYCCCCCSRRHGWSGRKLLATVRGGASGACAAGPSLGVALGQPYRTPTTRRLRATRRGETQETPQDLTPRRVMLRWWHRRCWTGRD